MHLFNSSSHQAVLDLTARAWLQTRTPILAMTPSKAQSLTVVRSQSADTSPIVVQPWTAEEAFLVRIELLQKTRETAGDPPDATPQQIETTRGSVSIIDLAHPRAMYLDSPHSAVMFHLPRCEVDAFSDHAGIPRLEGIACEVGTVDPVLVALAEAVLPSLQEQGFRNQTFLDSIDLAFKAHVANVYGRRPRITRYPVGGLAPWQERRAKDLLRNRWQNAMSINQIAKECKLSRGHFSKAFKQSTGHSPHNWLNRERVESAKHLLRTSHESVAEIALVCGFSDQSHFTRAFGRLVGTPPATWRKRAK